MPKTPHGAGGTPTGRLKGSPGHTASSVELQAQHTLTLQRKDAHTSMLPPILAVSSVHHADPHQSFSPGLPAQQQFNTWLVSFQPCLLCWAIKRASPPSLPPPGMREAPLCPRNRSSPMGAPAQSPALVFRSKTISHDKGEAFQRLLSQGKLQPLVIYMGYITQHAVCLHYQYFLNTCFET